MVNISEKVFPLVDQWSSGFLPTPVNKRKQTGKEHDFIKSVS